MNPGVKVSVFNPAGEPTQIELDPKIFGLEKINRDLVHQTVTSLLSTKRGPVAHSKTRGEVRGGGKKPWQQKGTGRARAGSIRSPLWRGGGITFGPRATRNWTRKINKNAKIQVLFTILSDKAKSEQLVIADNLNLSSAKTKELAAKLKDLRVKFPKLGRKLAIVAGSSDTALFRAGKNLPDIVLQAPTDMNILDLIAAQGIVIFKDVLPVIQKIYSREK